MPKQTKHLPVRGLLIHVSHYDPGWYRKKAKESPFDPAVAIEAIGAMAEVGMNMLIIDCADGVKYKSHPELRKHYTVPMRQLKKVADAAHRCGIEVVPKLNFSKSHRNHHDEWMAEHCLEHRWPHDQEYYRIAEDLFDELIQTCQPKRFFHIGMDEDHSRSLVQFVATIKKLHTILRKRRLRTVIWSDACHNNTSSIAQVHAEKCIAAEQLIPRDIVQMPWRYGKSCPSVVKRLTNKGFEVWVAPGWKLPDVKQWRRATLAGNGHGMILTTWRKCDQAHRDDLVELIRTSGAVL